MMPPRPCCGAPRDHECYPTCYTIMNPAAIYAGSDAAATKALYAALEAKGPLGLIALNLFRAQKASSRAKVYRRRCHKGAAYDKKEWSLRQLCDVLARESSLTWGWKEDPAQSFHKWVLYVDLPTGQVSFHAARPLTPDRYEGEWDGRHLSAERIIRYTDAVLHGKPYVFYTDIEGGNLTSREVQQIAEHLEQTNLL